MRSINAILPNCNVRAMEGILSTLGVKGIPIVGLSSVPRCNAFHSQHLCAKMISPPSTQENEFIDYLIREVPRGVLFTSDDQTTLLFSKNSPLLKANGFRLNVPEFDNLRTGFDKWRCYLKAVSLGIPCAFTHKIETHADLDHVKTNMPYPFILKATTLAGGNYFKVHQNSEVDDAYQGILQTIARQQGTVLNPEIIAQDWLEYDMEDIWCLEAYYDKLGNARGFMPIRKIRTEIKRDGTYGSRLYAGVSGENAELTSLSRKLLDSLHWKGFAHLDWIYSKKRNKYYLTEINPRLPGFSFFPSHAGFDMASYYYFDLTNEDFVIPPLKQTLYFEPLRYPGDISGTLSAILRRQYSLKKLISTYCRAIIGKSSVVMDFFDIKEPRMTVINGWEIALQVAGELFGLSRIFKRK